MNCIVYDISKWEVLPHLQTGGSRKKRIVKNPEDNDLYYYKTSLRKEKRYYKYEFWSEIIASKIGKYFGFNVLDYNIGILYNEVGCISKSMLSGTTHHELIEGRQYLAGTNEDYDPENKKCYNMYTFQFIEQALREYKIEYIMNGLLSTIVFDCIIGNSDRHQENWSIICLKTALNDHTNPTRNRIRKYINTKYSSPLVRMKLKLRSLFDKEYKYSDYMNIISHLKGVLAPIYDSGCCLAREYDDIKVQSIDIDKYIDSGKTEIRWEPDNNHSKKISHFELIKNIREYNKNYKTIIDSNIIRVLKKYDKNEIKDIVYNIDNRLSPCHSAYFLPKERKKVICDIIDKRLNKIREIVTI